MDEYSDALSALGVSAPAPAPAAAAQRAPSNNFGNIRPQGASTGFQKYDTPEAGLAAVDSNLKAYGSKGINTISGVIGRWAPPSENNTPAYISDVSKRLGIAPDAQIDLSDPFVRHALTTAITLHEHGPKILTAQRGQPQAGTTGTTGTSSLTSAPQVAQAGDEYADAMSALNGPAPAAAPAGNIPRIEIRGTSADEPALNANGVRPMFSPGTGSAGKGASKDPISSPEADLTLNQATGLASTVAGGLAGIGTGLYKLARTGSVDQAVDAGANTVKAVQEAGTYQPRTAEGQKMVEQFGSNYNPLSWIPNASQAIGDKAGTALENIGQGAAGALVKGIGAAAPLGLGFAAKPLSGMLKGAGEVADVARVDPTMAPAPVVKPAYKLVDGKPVLISEGAPPQMVSPTINPAQGPAGAMAAPSAPVAAPLAAPVPKPTLAQATPELQQAVAAATEKGAPINPNIIARHVEADTLPVPVKLTAGQASMDPSIISGEMNGRGKSQPPVSPDFYNAQGKALGANLDALRTQVAPDVTATHPAQIGQTLVDQYKAMDTPVRRDISSKYKALEDANGGQFPLNGRDFMAAADRSLEAKNVATFLPSDVASTLSKYREGGPMTYNNFENLRTILATASRKADAAADGNASHAINLVRESLESLPMTAETATIKPLADAARAAAKARFDKIKSDPAYKASVNDTVRAGEPSPLADKFVQSYLINGKGANVKQMKANLAGSDVAQQNIAAAGLDYLKGLSGADPLTGKFLADRYNKGLNQLGPKMDDIFDPKTAQQVQQVGNVAKYTTAQPKGSYVNNSNTLVGAASEAMKGTLEGMVNVGAMGVPVGTWIRKAAQNRAAAKASAASVEPGAGMKLADLPGSRP
jgi:hypothetical protein